MKPSGENISTIEDIEKGWKFRLVVSVFLGAVCFVVNYYPINMQVFPIIPGFFLGMICLMLVSQAWGWRYGLISAAVSLGGLGFLVLKGEGPDRYVLLVTYLFWIVWHGWCADRYRRSGDAYWNAYVMEIPFRAIASVSIFAALAYVLDFQPVVPSGAFIPDIDAGQYLPILIIKESLNAYIIILCTDILLQIGTIRSFLGLKQYPDQGNTYIVIGGAILLGVLFWLVEGLFEFYFFDQNIRWMIFQEPLTLGEAILFRVPPHGVFVRIAFMLACLVGGLTTAKLFRQQRQSEEALKTSEEKFRTLFETSMDVIYVTSLDSRILDVNRAGEELSGYSRGELISMNIRDLMVDHTQAEAYNEKILRDGFIKNFEIAYQKKDGSILYGLETALVRRDKEGRAEGIQGIIRDITDRKHMEQQLIQAEKLSSLGEILSGVAHELNNPLTAIIGNAEMLALKSLPDDIRSRLDVIVKESLRSARIVQGLLTFAREHRPERTMIDVNGIIRESLELRRYELDVSGVEVTLQLAERLPKTLADPYQLQQVLINLINNALDALTGTQGGTVVLTSFYRDDIIYISCRDNGQGIPNENQKRIFDPFFTTKEVGKGTGLGLSVAYGIIQKHDGDISVESDGRSWTTFIITLPLVTEPETRRTPAMELRRPSDRAFRVLVVEDENNLRNLMCDILIREGYLADKADCCERAMEMLAENTYHAVVSDMKMPGMTGMHLYEIIQERYPKLGTKVLFITGDVLGWETQKFLRETGAPYVEKPFQVNIFLTRLNNMLDAES